MEIIFSIIIWAIIGALPAFYVAYFKRYQLRTALFFGAFAGVLIGEIAVQIGIIATQGSAIVTIFGLAFVAALLLPYGKLEEQITMQGRITQLAYALTIPTALIVLGIVIFPVIWNVIFSVRDIRTADLATVELFNFDSLTLDNFIAQASLRIDTLPCEIDEETGECARDANGNIIYPQARRYFGTEYRGFNEATNFTLGDDYYAISVRNRDFYPMLFRTLFYTLASTILAITAGLVAALLVRDAFPGRGIFRGFLLFPYIAPVISVAFVWQALLRQNGFINELADTRISFLTTSDTWLGLPIPLVMVILFQTWRYFPFAFLFMLARLQAIPDDIYEAAKVDGAAPSQRLWLITLPQLRAVIGTLFLLRFIWTFNKFDDVYLLTGPIESTRVISVQIFELLFTNGNIGQASAVAVVMALMLAVVLAIYFRFFLVEEN